MAWRFILSFLISAVGGKFTCGSFYPRRKLPPVPLNRKLMGPQVRSVAAERSKIPVGISIPGLLSSRPWPSNHCDRAVRPRLIKSLSPSLSFLLLSIAPVEIKSRNQNSKNKNVQNNNKTSGTVWLRSTVFNGK